MPLLKAVADDPSAISILLLNDYPPDLLSEALYRLAKAGKCDVSCAKKLIARGATARWVDPESGNTALHAACENNLILLDLLLENGNGADVNCRNKDGITPLIALASSKSENPHQIKLIAAEKLIQAGAGADVTCSPRMDFCSALEAAARYNPHLVELLLRNGAPITNKAAQLAMHHASVDALQHLLYAGAVLSKACIPKEAGNSVEMLNFVVKHIDYSTSDFSADSAILNCVVGAPGDNVELVEYLFEVDRATTERDMKTQDVHLAAIKQGNSKIVDFLLKNGVDVSQQYDTCWETMLGAVVSVGGGSLEVAKCLVNAGADVNYIFKYDKCTPLMLAARNFPHLVDFLVESGADVNVSN